MDRILAFAAQILGHENLNATSGYTKRTNGQLAEAAEIEVLLD